MEYFQVNECIHSACNYWRIGNKCVKDSMQIKSQIKYVHNLHDASWCEIRKQVNIYRLERMLND